MSFEDMRAVVFRCHLACCALALILFAAGCATPIGVTRGSTQEIYRALTVNALSAGEPSSWSKQVLQRNNLTEQYDVHTRIQLNQGMHHFSCYLPLAQSF